MEYISLNEHVTLSRIIQGFWRLTEWNFNTEELVDFMEKCIKFGVTSFDTAEIYGGGECEIQMGKAIEKLNFKRNEYQIITKTGISSINNDNCNMGYYDTTYDRIINSCKKSIRNLKCEYIDVYLIHREDPCIDHYQVAKALNYLLKQGLVKSVGVSNFDPFKFDALNYALGGKLVTNQIEINPICFEHFNSGMVDVLVKNKISPMIWSPLCGGKIFNNNEDIYLKANKKLKEIADRHNIDIDTLIYAWLMYHPMNGMPISGSSQISRLQNAIKALEVKLHHWEWYEIYIASGQQIIR